MKRPLTRRETAPRNVAARALRGEQFQPKVEKDPKAYTRRPKHKNPPSAGEEKPPETGPGPK